MLCTWPSRDSDRFESQHRRTLKPDMTTVKLFCLVILKMTSCLNACSFTFFSSNLLSFSTITISPNYNTGCVTGAVSMEDLAEYVSCNQYLLSENFYGFEHRNRRLM